MNHFSVLLNESLAGLKIKPTGIYVDGTLGRGGHSLAIVKQLTTGQLYSFDLDQQALAEVAPQAKAYHQRWTLIHANFKDIKTVLTSYQITAVDGILLDLGVSSPQFDEAARGFSYRFDSRLDMRMDQSQTLTAYEIVNNYSAEQLLELLYTYGEERYAQLIVKGILQARADQPLTTTFELVDVIKSVLPGRVLRQKGHPAKQTFQALRIAVNDELTSLKKVLTTGLDLLNPAGRMAVITFHSLEDRLVKQSFNQVSQIQVDKRLVLPAAELPQPAFCLVNKKPILPTEAEIQQNHRSQGAKLRIIEKR